MKKILLLSVITIVTLACKDNGVAPPITSANIHGNVLLYDESINIVSEQGGMVVTIDGTSPEIIAASDIDGVYTLRDVPFGTYDFTFFKEGYGIFKLYGIVHELDTTVDHIHTFLEEVPKLGKFSSTQVTLVETTTTANDVTTATTMNPPATTSDVKFLRFFYHTESTVSDTNYLIFSKIVKSKFAINQHILTKAELNDMGFASGTTVFVKVYGESFISNTYDDPVSGLTVFPNLNEVSAPAASFVVP